MLAILQPSTLNLVDVIRINIITAFGNEDEDTTLWLTVCPTCRAGPAHAEVSSLSTRYACKYAFQPASEEIHQTIYGILEDLCGKALGDIWRISQQPSRRNSFAEAAGARANRGSMLFTNSMLCAHSAVCLNSK